MIQFCKRYTFNETNLNGAKRRLINTGPEQFWKILSRHYLFFYPMQEQSHFVWLNDAFWVKFVMVAFISIGVSRFIYCAFTV
jgi:hypothetical protein